MQKIVREKTLDNLVFRQYDPYAVAATSLLCQLAAPLLVKDMLNESEQEKRNSDYQRFYRFCFELRDQLGQSVREIEEMDTPEYMALKRIYGADKKKGSSWSKIVSFMESHDTKEFMELLGHFDDNLSGLSAIYLNPKGIYKRIRNLNHTLWQQRAVGHLEWELGRYDLLGYQLNCLFKNQVFAVYEQLWNTGDPFLNIKTGRTVEDEDDFLEQGGRQRWFCLRTQYHQGEYNSLQIAALADPHAIEGGFWRDPGYNLRRVQTVLQFLLEKFDKKFAGQYKRLAFHRQRLCNSYTLWNRIANDAIQDQTSPTINKEKINDEDNAVWFGSFLGEAVIDYIMGRIDGCKDLNKNEILDIAKEIKLIREPLIGLLEYCKDYTDRIVKNLTMDKMGMNLFSIRSLDNDFLKNIKKIYDILLNPSSRPNTSKNISQQSLSMFAKREYDYFLGLVEGRRQLYPNKPIMFVPYKYDIKGLNELWKSLDAGTTLKKDMEHSLEHLYVMLDLLRRKQNTFLFFEGSTQIPGFILRNKSNVLHRIQNYVLLFNSNDSIEIMKKNNPQGSERNDLHGWTSYDLFYYLRSLIPLEVQVRTELANTMSEQYHDSVYKGSPPKGTEFPRQRMESIGKQLDNLDNDMEIDYEDYIIRRVFASDKTTNESK